MNSARKPRICAVITGNDLKVAREVEPLADLFEVRIDLIGEDWPDIVKRLKIPWIACNRLTEEGGSWHGDETARIETLVDAIELGASIVDIELRTKELEKVLSFISGRAELLISFHDLVGTPSLAELKAIVKKQKAFNAGICKVVTTARSFEDNLTVLKLISEFSGGRLISFAMGTIGSISRVLSPLVGGDFTYASVGKGKESAPGQMTVDDLVKLYEILGVWQKT